MDKLIDSFFTHTQMALGAEEFLGQKVREKLQVQIDQRAGRKALTKNEKESNHGLVPIKPAP
jgi:hypothetical protein